MLVPIRNQFSSFWKRQHPTRQITIVALVLTVFILVPVLVSWATAPSYVIAYSGLSEADASQIVLKMDDNSIPYQIKNNGTILVPSEQVYTTRLLMAREGLPKSSTVGYELFSGNTLGMTEFSQKVNYQRALEGELERTIGSLSVVKAVRVHVVTPAKTLLSSDQTATTASVTLQIAPGQSMDATQVRAITHLVASSVEGLKPENVVVVDSEGNMLADGTGTVGDPAMSTKTSQRTAEQEYALELQKRVQALLDKILGPNKSIVQATVEMDWTQREVTSNKFEPTTIALRSSQKINELSNSANGSTGGVPGASSNLPTPVATSAAAAGSADYQRSEETLNYEVSQVQSHEVVAPGKINRMSVSVMVDNITDQAQLDSITAAVQVAAGIDATRGDQIVVESYAFDRTASDALAADLASQQQQELYMQIGIAVGSALLLIVLLFFVLRMINNLRNASKENWRPVLRPVAEMAALQGAGMGAGNVQLPGGIPAVTAALAARAELQGPQTPSQDQHPEDEGVVLQINSSRNQHSTVNEDEQRARVIARLTEENPATVAEIIQIWLNEGKKG
ncbi:MAG: flagellar basal-body MS-ring/collar protein FliF [Chloroflexi bacterium]|nr:flagellar basal-body MS-ring/collar protein FliF [Chloroflexota bacterium]